MSDPCEYEDVLNIVENAVCGAKKKESKSTKTKTSSKSTKIDISKLSDVPKQSYCLSCKKATGNKDIELFKSETGNRTTYRISAKCSVCGKNKSKIISPNDLKK